VVRVRRFEQVLLVEAGRLGQQARQQLAPLLLLRPLGGGWGQLDPGSLGQGAQRLREVPAFLLHREREDVPAFAAAKAAPVL
jgi:hypothetical protein